MSVPPRLNLRGAPTSPGDGQNLWVSPAEGEGARARDNAISNPPALPAARKLPLSLLAGMGLLATVGAAVLFCFDPRRYHFYPVCFFHSTTGFLCPGCGGLRALHQLLHGHLATAFRFNPMLIASLPFVFWLGAQYLVQRTRNQPAKLGVRPFWLWLFLAAVLVVSVLRNLPGPSFAMLRP